MRVIVTEFTRLRKPNFNLNCPSLNVINAKLSKANVLTMTLPCCSCCLEFKVNHQRIQRSLWMCIGACVCTAPLIIHRSGECLWSELEETADKNVQDKIHQSLIILVVSHCLLSNYSTCHFKYFLSYQWMRKEQNDIITTARLQRILQGAPHPLASQTNMTF